MNKRSTYMTQPNLSEEEIFDPKQFLRPGLEEKDII